MGGDNCLTVSTLVIIQENGLIRLPNGLLVAKLLNDVGFKEIQKLTGEGKEV